MARHLNSPPPARPDALVGAWLLVICAAVIARNAEEKENDDAQLAEQLWDVCRTSARTRLDDLAERIEPIAGWNDLVMPAAQQQTLRDIAAQVRQRTRVYYKWGFAAKGSRGLGINALFSGASGTGKTMAAEVLARELRLGEPILNVTRGSTEARGCALRVLCLLSFGQNLKLTS